MNEENQDAGNEKQQDATPRKRRTYNTKSSYSEKLRDPRWQKVRLEVMQRDSFTCLCCGDDKSTLNVHHLEYQDNPWETPLELLETLCEKCHKDREEKQKLLLAKIRRLPTKNFIGTPFYSSVFDGTRRVYNLSVADDFVEQAEMLSMWTVNAVFKRTMSA